MSSADRLRVLETAVSIEAFSLGELFERYVWGEPRPSRALVDATEALLANAAIRTQAARALSRWCTEGEVSLDNTARFAFEADDEFLQALAPALVCATGDDADEVRARVLSLELPSATELTTAMLNADDDIEWGQWRALVSRRYVHYGILASDAASSAPEWIHNRERAAELAVLRAGGRNPEVIHSEAGLPRVVESNGFRFHVEFVDGVPEVRRLDE